MKKCLFAFLLAIAAFSQSANAGVVISGFMANPAGTDGNNEYVQLVATSNTNFGTTPWSVVWANNGTATANGWVNGAAITYGFNITSGTVNAGDVFYVGGSGKLLNGAGSANMAGLTWLRDIAVATTAGDGFGNANANGVMGNGGANADGIGTFQGLTSSLTNASTPFDAVFYGAGLGNAVVGGGTAGYKLPTNDIYAGGFLGSAGNTTIFGDPASGNFNKLTGTYNALTNSWSVTRTSGLATPTTLADITSGITIITSVPEPSSIGLLVVSIVGGGLFKFRRRRVESN